MASVFTWLGSKVATVAKDKIAEHVSNASQEFGVLTDEQYAKMAEIVQSVKSSSTQQAQTALQSLASRISAEEYNKIHNLIQAQNVDDLEAWVTAKKDHTGTAGLVRKAATTFFSTMTEQAKSHLGAWYDNFSAPAPELNAFSEALQGMTETQVKPATRSEAEVTGEIAQQRATLIQNSTQMAMAKTVLGWACGIQSLSNESIVSYIEDAASNGTEFRDVVFREIDQANNVNGLRRFLAKACYVVLEPVVGFYVDHFTTNFLNYLKSQLEEFHNGHFAHALNRSVKFANGHLQMVEGAYVRAANHPQRSADIDDLIKQDLEGRPYNGNMTPNELFARVAEEAIERFAPVSSVRERVSELLSIRIEETSGWAWLNYPLGVITGVTDLVLTPIFFLIEWGGNALAKAVLKKLSVDLQLVPTLMASTSQAVGIGEEYKHALNEFVVQQLERAWELMTSHEDSNAQVDLSAFERDLSDTTRANLKSFVGSLFLDLGYTMHSDNPANLAAYIEGQKTSSMPESLKALFEALGLPLDVQEEAKETTVRYLALLLSTVLQKETLNELTLTSLSTLNQSCFSSGGQRPTKEQMAATELRRNKLLNDIINTAIRQAVNDKFYPMQRIQKEANQFVRQTLLDVAQFTASMNALKGEGSFSEMLTSYNRFIVDRDKALSSQQGSSNVNNHSLTNFNAISTALAAKLAPMREVLTTLSTCEKTTNLADLEQEAFKDLHNIFARFSSEDHSDPNTRGVSLQMMQTFEKEKLPNLKHSQDLSDLKIRDAFGEIVQVMSDYSSAQEGVAVAQYLKPMVERGDPYKQIVAAIGAYSFTSPLAETHRQSLYAQAKAGTLDDTFLESMISQNQGIIDGCTKTLTEKAELTKRIQTHTDQRVQTLATTKSTIEEQKQALERHFDALTEWASDKDAIERQISALNSKSEDSPEWNTETLQPFQCQNTFPIDLTAFADTVREFVVRQIAAYTHAIPLFYAKEYNLEAFMRRLMVAFVEDQNG